MGVRFCRASPRDKSSLCRARKWREPGEKRGKGTRDRRKREKMGKREKREKEGSREVHYIYLGCISGGAWIPKPVSGLAVT